jgi:hypothetical protein
MPHAIQNGYMIPEQGLCVQPASECRLLAFTEMSRTANYAYEFVTELSKSVGSDQTVLNISKGMAYQGRKRDHKEDSAAGTIQSAAFCWYA